MVKVDRKRNTKGNAFLSAENKGRSQEERYVLKEMVTNRRQGDGISAGKAECRTQEATGGRSALILFPADSEFLHAGLQSGAFHSEFGGGAVGASDNAAGLAEGQKNVFAFDVLERGSRSCQVRG